MSDPDDICVWPCGTWCYRSDLDDYLNGFLSDDYEIIPWGDPRHSDFAEDNTP